MADAAKTLLRTAVRTFFPQAKQVLIIDALMLHSVLHLDDLAVLLASQPKDIRGLINPLKQARLLATGTRDEVRAGANTRQIKRDYFYTPFHPAIDAIKYKIARLRRKIETLYQRDETKVKQWRCPRCKAEYEELEVMDKIGMEGFYCDKCGTTLVSNDAVVKDAGNHEKIRKLNTQLAKFDQLMHKIDGLEIPENDFLSAWERKKDVPRREGYHDRSAQYVELKRDTNKGRGPETVNTKNLAINLTSSTEQEIEEEAAREERKKKLAQQNQLPDWMAKSAIGPSGSAVKTEELASRLKKEESEEKKPIVTDMEDEVAKYMAEMERERQEAEQKAKEEDAESDEGDEDDEFEDVVGTSAVGTPMSSQPGVKRESNGLKREYDAESGPSSSAGTPASTAGRDNKRLKLENGDVGAYSGNGVKAEAESEEDEDDAFEDVV